MFVCFFCSWPEQGGLHALPLPPPKVQRKKLTPWHFDPPLLYTTLEYSYSNNVRNKTLRVGFVIELETFDCEIRVEFD